MERFKRYLETDLLPHLNGNSVLIMDNMKSHHAKAVKNLLDSSGVRYIYLPLYSPDLNPIGYAQYKGFPVICNLSRLSVKRKDKEMRVLTPSERESLIGILMEDMDSFKFGVFLALYTGIRIGELCALQWKDIDFARATLKVRKTIQRIQNIDRQAVSKTKIVISVPKSKCSIREIPLSVSVMDIAQNFISYPESYVLTGTSRYIEPRTMQNHFKLYVKQSGISDANFHALRHTFATRCVEVGFEIKSLSEILGHASVNITLNRYVHSSFELKRFNMSKLIF